MAISTYGHTNHNYFCITNALTTNASFIFWLLISFLMHGRRTLTSYDLYAHMCPLPSDYLDIQNKTHSFKSLSQQCLRCSNINGFANLIHNQNFEEASFLLTFKYNYNKDVIISAECTDVVNSDRQTKNSPPEP